MLHSFRQFSGKSPKRLVYSLVFLCFLSGCLNRGDDLPEADKDNGGLYLPDGFEAFVVVDSLGGGPMPVLQQNPSAGKGRPQNGNKRKPFRSNQGKRREDVPQRNYFGSRAIGVSSAGDVYVKLRVSTPNGQANAALRDTDGDGRMDSIVYWGKYQSGQYGNAMSVHNGYLYYSSELYVFRSKLIPGTLLPEAKVDTIVIDDGPSHEHITKPLAFDGKGHLFVAWGAGSNSCQEANRVSESMGMGNPDDPANGCPLLEDHGGIWMFDENKLNQHQSDGVKYATGLRSLVAMDWDGASNSLYTVMHGTDDFALSWPQYFDYWQGAMLPSEEFFKVPPGFDGGWPYYYYDQMQQKKLLAPEYGGDGKKEANGAKVGQPLVGFPGHFAPNGLLFYKGDQFPPRYKNGAFIAFHGSTNRPPYPQGGYIVAFVPMQDGKPTGPWEVFADGFGGMDTIPTVHDAVYRPMGLAEGPDGSLYVGDTQKGKIWRILFKGNSSSFGEKQLAGMEKRKQTAPNLKTPDRIKDNLENSFTKTSSAVYTTYCRACHQANGMGDGTRFPPLAASEWVVGDKAKLADVVLNGMSGPITVKGVSYNEVMPAHGSFLSNDEIAEVLTYIRQEFGNEADAVTPAEVAEVRAKSAKKQK